MDSAQVVRGKIIRLPLLLQIMIRVAAESGTDSFQQCCRVHHRGELPVEIA
jgi:hypothetical protein